MHNFKLEIALHLGITWRYTPLSREVTRKGREWWVIFWSTLSDSLVAPSSGSPSLPRFPRSQAALGLQQDASGINSLGCLWL